MQYCRHYKGNYYRVIGEARHSETLDSMVVYQAMYRHSADGVGVEPAPEGGEMWVRPKEMFHEMVTLADGRQVARFAPVSEAECQAYLHASSDGALQAMLPPLIELFKAKGYTAEDFYGGCALCGDANEFALDIIDAHVQEVEPTMSRFDRDRLTSRLYSALHKQFEAEES